MVKNCLETYIALVSWVVRCLPTELDAWLHGTDTAPSGSSLPPRRGRRSQGVLTGRTTQGQAHPSIHPAFFFYIQTSDRLWGFGSWAVLTLAASVSMSLESFTRHWSGTVTSMTFALSCLLLLSVTNFPYQALRMMSPGAAKQQKRSSVSQVGMGRHQVSFQHP